MRMDNTGKETTPAASGNRNLAFLAGSCLLASFGLGYAKFFGLEHLCSKVYGEEQRPWIIQAVGALMTLGPAAAYAVSGPLAQALSKRTLMSASAAGAALLILAGHFAGWTGSAWFYLFMVGLVLGLYSAGKMASVPLQAESCGRSAVFVNAVVSILFVVGIIAGAPAGTLAYHGDPLAGVWIGAAIFGLAGVLALPLVYPMEKKASFRASMRNLPADTIFLLMRHPLYLSAGPMLWGVASAAVLAVTAYALGKGAGDATACSIMPLYAAVGTVAGNALSPAFHRKRYAWALFSALIMAALLAAIPYSPSFLLPAASGPAALYALLASLAAIMGIFFGIATNLVDAELLERVSADGMGGTGAALQSALISMFSFTASVTIGCAIYYGLLGPETQFLLLAGITLAVAALLAALALARGALDGLLMRLSHAALSAGLRLRYRVRVEGFENIPDSKGGIVFLPNHPALVDPVILMCLLWPKFRPRPVVDESISEQAVSGWIMSRLDAIKVPDMRQEAGWLRLRRAGAAIAETGESLRKGRNVLIYPAGHLMASGLERLGASSGARTILDSAPGAAIVLVRTRGLWGSSFSRARFEGGRTPALMGVILSALKAFAGAGLFFLPKRNVSVSFHPAPESFPRGTPALEMNRWLDSFYNQPGEEPDTWVSYGPFGPSKPKAGAGALSGGEEDVAAPEELRKAAFKEIARLCGAGPETIKPELRLSEDLGMDSLAKAELLVWLDENYGAGDVGTEALGSVASVLRAAMSPPAQSSGQRREGVGGWNVPQGAALSRIEAETVAEAFLKATEKDRAADCCADAAGHPFSRLRMRSACVFMARAAGRLPDERIGVLLPASPAAATAIIGILLAGKTPVLLNWTTGRRALEHALALSGTKAVLSSSAFLDRLRGLDLDFMAGNLVFLEELRKKSGLAELVMCRLLANRDSDVLLRDFAAAEQSADSTAAILFTSGSESAPKGVPLSNANILANIRAALTAVSIGPEDAMLACLPPFHSFGLTITTLLPLLSGLRVAFHPNPADGKALAAMLRRFRATILFGTPAFISGIYRSSSGGDLESLRLVVSGAEKAPESLKAAVASATPRAALLEGYGSTECSPVISLTLPGEMAEGVGRPLPGVEVAIAARDAQGGHRILPAGETGTVAVRGKSVFSGYLGGSPDPFIVIGGAPWYDTGDLGFLSPSGAIMLAGRRKRFVKSGGEMISLPALEAALSGRWPPAEDEGPCLAVEADETGEGKPRIVLFTTRRVTLEEANATLKETGFSALSRLSGVETIPAMPLLGSGKLDHQTLKEMLKKG